jgi:hypothetical protein
MQIRRRFKRMRIFLPSTRQAAIALWPAVILRPAIRSGCGERYQTDVQQHRQMADVRYDS